MVPRVGGRDRPNGLFGPSEPASPQEDAPETPHRSPVGSVIVAPALGRPEAQTANRCRFDGLSLGIGYFALASGSAGFVRGCARGDFLGAIPAELSDDPRCGAFWTALRSTSAWRELPRQPRPRLGHVAGELLRAAVLVVLYPSLFRRRSMAEAVTGCVWEVARYWMSAMGVVHRRLKVRSVVWTRAPMARIRKISRLPKAPARPISKLQARSWLGSGPRTSAEVGAGTTEHRPGPSHERAARNSGWSGFRRPQTIHMLDILRGSLGQPPGPPRPYAQTLSSLVMVAEAGAFAWRLVMFLHLVSIYFNPFNPDKHRFFYPTCVLLLASLSAGPCCVYLASAPQDSKAYNGCGLVSTGCFRENEFPPQLPNSCSPHVPKQLSSAISPSSEICPKVA